MIDFVIYCSLLIIVLVLLLGIPKNFLRPPNFPPGPRWLPLVGNASLLKRLSIFHHGFHNALIHLSEKYGTPILGLKLGADLFVVVFSKNLIKQVFTEEEFQGRPDSYFIRLRTMGSRKGITMTDGELWKEQRNFAVRHLRSLGFGKLPMESLIIEELQDLVERLASETGSTDLHSELAPCVLNVLWAMTAGYRFTPKDPQLGRLLMLMSARSKAFDMAGGVLSQLPYLRYVAPEWSGYNLIQSLNQEMKTLLEKTIQEHKKTVEEDNIKDFIDAYLQEINTTNNLSTTFTEEQLVMVCLDFFIAGSQTTSNTLSFALLNMVLHQGVQDRVFAEIKDVLGERRLPSIEDKSKLSYVETVLLESQRFLHVVPVAGPRRVLRHTRLNGYDIPKNTTILLSLYSMHHDKDIWNEPMDFNPDRFLDEENRKLMDELYQFGLGKRRCLGEALAKNFVFLFFTGIMRNYHLKVDTGSEPLTTDPVSGITLSPKPYKVFICPRQD